MYRHNVESFKKMWLDIGEDLGMKLSVEGELVEADDGLKAFHQSDTRVLRFVIRLV